MTLSIAAQLERHTDRPSDDACWIWTASLDRHGYGQVGVATEGRRRTCRAHRLWYETYVGPIPSGFDLDHLCRNRACVNPAHLETVTRLENHRRARAWWREAGLRFPHASGPKSQCKRGHDWSSVWVSPGDGRRRCLTCMQNRKRARRRTAA